MRSLFLTGVNGNYTPHSITTHTRTKRSHRRIFLIQLLKADMPPYAISLPDTRLEKKIVNASPWRASNDERERVQGQLQPPSFSSQTE